MNDEMTPYSFYKGSAIVSFKQHTTMPGRPVYDVNLELFELFVRASSDKDGAKFVHSAVAVGADVNASILTDKTLLAKANERYEYLTKCNEKHQKLICELQDTIKSYKLYRPTTPESKADFTKTISSLRQAMITYESKIKPTIKTTKYIIDDINLGYSPIHIAALVGATETMEALFAYGANLEAKAGTSTPISLACSVAKTEVVKWLLDHGANLDGYCAKLYKKMVVRTSQNPFELLGWLIERIDDQDNGNRNIFVEALKNFLENTESSVEPALTILMGESPEFMLDAAPPT